MTGGVGRLARGTVVGLLCVGLSAVGHVGAGGHADVRVVAGLSALAVGICTLLSALEWTLPRLLVVLGVAQVVVHYALEAGMTTSMTPVAPGGGAAAAVGGGMPGMDPMPGMGAAPLDPTWRGSAVLASPAAGESAYPSSWMLWAHVIAVVAASLAVRYGEQLARRVVDVLSTPLLRAAPPAPEPLPDVPTPLAHPWVPAAGRSLPFASSVVRRGPPVPVCG